MSNNNPIGCCHPKLDTIIDKWCVKMDAGVYNPSYFLVNRKEDSHPWVALQKDIDGTSTASIYFDDEQHCWDAIRAYIRFHQQRGEMVQGIYPAVVIETPVESQVMEFE